MNKSPLVQLSLNGIKANLLIDTGATVTVLDTNQQRYYGFRCLELNQHGTITGIGGKRALRAVTKAKLACGPHGLRYQRLFASDLSFLNKKWSQSGLRIAGILGSDFLIHNAAKIDYQNKVLTLAEL